MTAVTEDRSIFENEEWLVAQDGLEHKATGYFIDRDSLGQRREDGLWTWPLHMAEKTWCSMTPFAEAFSCAAAVYGLEAGADLAQTFKTARCEISAWPHRDFDASIPAPLIGRSLQNGRGAPIYWEPGSPEKSVTAQEFQVTANGRRTSPQTRKRPASAGVPLRPTDLAMVRSAAIPWRTPRRIRQTGTKLVRLIQAAWNTR